MIAASYPFLDVLWTMVIFFIWILWFTLLFRVWGDIFRRHDLSGWGKTGWLIFTIILPFLGVFIYVITQNEGMTQRKLDQEIKKAMQEVYDGLAKAQKTYDEETRHGTAILPQARHREWQRAELEKLGASPR